MQLTSFQLPQIRDANDNIIQEGAYGKYTALTNSQNTGVLDYINNNLMYLYNNKANGNDVYTKTEADGRYLKLSGGTVNGAIKFVDANCYVSSSANGTNLNIGWDYTNRAGALLGLRGKNNTTQAGRFYLMARDETNESTLSGYPNGELTWGGKNVLTQKDHYYLQIGGGATVTIDYNGYNCCVLHYVRGGMGGIIAWDTWSYSQQLVIPATNPPTFSCSSKVITLKNNHNVAISVGIDLYI